MPKIPFNTPYITGNERAYIDEVFANGHFAGNGPFTKRAQTWMEERWGIEQALLTHSCTGALEMAALVLDLGPGDEVILPSFTFISTATAFMRAGATPVFCEIDPATMTLDVADAASRVTERTKAIVAVHYGGVAADMSAVIALAEEHNLQVIEDAAQGIDASRGGRTLGTIAPLACLSFHETKNIHCGLGGALLINDSALVDRATTIWERGTNRRQFFKGLVDKYSWVDIGSSFYPSELQAAFLMAQLEGLGADLAHRATVWTCYHDGLKGLEEAGKLRRPVVPAGCESNHHNYWVRLNSPAQADTFREHLNANGVHAVIHYVPLHDSTMGEKLGYSADSLPITQVAAGSLIRLPMHFKLTPAEADQVVAVIASFFK
jgi:dTDP-4-amino-4,6-dideoxygalactose transaminase